MSRLTVGTLPLTPVFDGETISYTATTRNATNKVTVAPADSNAVVEIKLGDTVIENGSNASWADGENTLSINVTNGSQSTTYTVIVTKE